MFKVGDKVRVIRGAAGRDTGTISKIIKIGKGWYSQYLYELDDGYKYLGRFLKHEEI